MPDPHPLNTASRTSPSSPGSSDNRQDAVNDHDTRHTMMGLHKMVPNLMTLAAVAAGLTAIQYAFNGLWSQAVLAILAATILDAMDGATARLLKAQSDFGAQLDSLSDFLAFGVAPSIILYAWILEESGKIGWIAMIVYAAATALRLARYNVDQAKAPTWKKGFFAGIPSPAGAGLALLPLILWLQFPDFFEQFGFASPLVGLWMIFVGALMVSRIPTFSTKSIRLPAKMGVPVLGLAALVMAALINAPWPTLSILAITYIISIPFAIRRFQRLQKEYADDEDLADMALGAITLDEHLTPHNDPDHNDA